MFSCTELNCNCTSYKPGVSSARRCDICHHDWVGHAIRNPFEETMPSVRRQSLLFQQSAGLTSTDVCEVSSLILFGAQAIPIRLKILLDRLFASFSQLETQKLLGVYGWSLKDLQRGYILEDNNGCILNHWSTCSKEEETKIIQCFLRFRETGKMAADFLAQDIPQRPAKSQEQPQNSATTAVTEPVSFQSAHSNGLNGRLLSDLKSAILSNALTALGQSTNFLPAGESNENGGMDIVSISRSVDIDRLGDSAEIRRDRFRSLETRSNPPESRTGSPSFESYPERLCRSANVTPEPKEDSDEYGPCTAKNEDMEEEEQSGSLGLVISNSDHAEEPKDLSIDRDRPIATVNPVGGTPKFDRSPPSMFPNPMQNLYFSGKRVNQSSKETGGHNGTTPNQRNFGSPAGSGSSSSGKRRVSCDACHKTFCDKGALKIHYSAVHLREMHECTVPGCAMLFSSRRSRNRHSANPNPKLHTSSPRKGSQPEPGHYRVVSPPEAVHQFERSIVEEQNQRSNTSSADILMETISGGSVENRSRKRKGQPTKLSSGPNFPVENKGDSGVKHEKSEVWDDDNNLPLDFSTKRLKTRTALDEESAIKQLDDFTRNLSELKGLTTPISEPAESLAHKFWVRSLIAPQDKTTPCPNVSCFLTPPKASSTTSESRSPSPSNKCASVSPVSQVSSSLAGENGQIGSTMAKTHLGSVSIPINEDNPRQCTQCGKLFQNHFSVKTHFQNVHLKLMHKCTVHGCNASFPSKRSRDRHSANQNLHRKLLSGPRDGSAALQGSLVTHISSANHQPHKDRVIHDSNHVGQESAVIGGSNNCSATQTPQMNGAMKNKDGTPSPGNGPGNVMNGAGMHQGFRPHDFFHPLYGGYQPSFLPFATPGLMSQLAAVRMAAAGPMSPFFSTQQLAANLAAAANAQAHAARKVNACKSNDLSPLSQGHTGGGVHAGENGKAEPKSEKAESAAES